MKKWIKFLLLAIVLGAFTVFLVFKFYINKPHPDFEKLRPDYITSTEEIYKEFTSDKFNSEKKYNGKIVQLTGILDKIESYDSIIVAVFVFKVGDFGDEGVRCTMLPKFNEEISKFNLKTPITLKAFCSGYNDTDVILENGSIIK